MKRASSRRALLCAVSAMEPLDSRIFLDGTGPSAFASLPTPASGSTAATLTVDYFDSTSPVQLATLRTGNIVITGPNGFTETPAFVSADSTTDSEEIEGTYQFAAPGGTFDSSDNGTYTVALQANQVEDEADNFAAAATLTSTTFKIPDTIVSTGPITGISVGSDGRLQVLNSQFNSGQFFPPSSFPSPGNAGISLRLSGGTTFGQDGDALHNESETQSSDGLTVTTVNDDGTADDGTGQIFQDTEVVSYQPGNPFFNVQNTIKNIGASAITFDYFFSADLYLADSDSGTGFFNPSTLAVGGTDSTGQYNIFLQPDPTTPAYTNYQEGFYSSITGLPGSTLDYNNTVEPQYQDNGAGIEWKSVTLQPGASTTLGFFAAFGNITTISTGPTATLVSAPDVTSASATSEDITVTFNDNTTVDASTLSGDEIQVVGPNGFTQNATLVSTGLTNGNQVTATYALTPAGGFKTSGNGTYTIDYLANSVDDLQGNGNGAATLGTFNVALPPVTAPPVQAKVGGLDPNFGNGQGVAKVTLANEKAVTAGIVTQNDGKLIVAATITPAAGGNSDFEVFRLNADGTIDTTFGNNGFARANFPNSATATGVQLLKDGRILVIGSEATADGSRDFAFARFNSDGSLDTSLQGTGRGTQDFTALRSSSAPTDDVARAVAINANGSFYIAGSSTAGGSDLSNFALARFNSDGSLDTSFNKGAVFFNVSGSDVVNAIAVQKNGQIVLAGSMSVSGKPTQFAVARVNANGKPDPTFGTGTAKKGTVGFEVIPIGNVDDEAFAVAIQPDNKIVVGGYTATGSLNGGSLATKFALVRLQVNGKLDPTFNKTGKVLTPFSGEQLSSITALSITGTGASERILASGKAASTLSNGLTSIRAIALARYTITGALDTRFGTLGKSLLLQPDTLGQFSALSNAATPSLQDQFNSFTQDAEGDVARTSGGGIRALASDNNTSSTSVFVAAVVPDGVDLLGALKTTGPAKVLGGVAATGAVTISDDGSLPVNGTIGVTYYASTDQDLSSDDTAFATQNISSSFLAGQSKPFPVKFNYPKTLATGQYFIIADVNTGKKPIAEINLANNEADSKAVTIQQPFVDLSGVFKAPPATISKGKGTLSLAVTNHGNVAATGALTVMLFAAPTNTFTGAEPQIPTTKLATGINPGMTKVLTLNYNLPAGAVPPGSDFLYAVLEYAGSPADSVPGNNAFFSSKTVSFK